MMLLDYCKKVGIPYTEKNGGIQIKNDIIFYLDNFKNDPDINKITEIGSISMKKSFVFKQLKKINGHLFCYGKKYDFPNLIYVGKQPVFCEKEPQKIFKKSFVVRMKILNIVIYKINS